MLASLASAGPAAAETLADIGFLHGLTLRGPHAEAQVYFPLPQSTSDADLAIDMTPSAAIDQLSSVTVYVGDEPLATIPTRDGARVVHVTVPARLADGDFLHVRFAADQALRRDEQCFDNDNPAVWTHIAPTTELIAAGGAESGIGTVWRDLGGEVDLSLPAEPTLDDLQAGLTLATAITVRGSRPVMVSADDNRVQIRVVHSATPLALEWISGLVANTSLATPPRTFGRILVSGSSAARALVAAGTVLRGAQSASVSSEVRQGLKLSDPDSISFAEMGLHPPLLSVYSTAFVDMEIPFNRLPAGRKPVAIQLFGRGAAPPVEEALVVTLSVGNRLLWSQTFRGEVELDGVKVNLPEDLVRHHMMVNLRVVRVGSHRECGADDSLAFDLRDTTRFFLDDGGPNPPNFAAFAMPADRAALVRFDGPAAQSSATIPLIASILSDAGARPAAIEVAGRGGALDRPFIVVATVQPTDLTGTAPTRLESGRIVLDRPADSTRVTLNNAASLTMVQLAAAGTAPGIWLSPGSSASLARPSPLSAGDVAVFDGVGALPVSFETRPVGVVIERPMSSLADRLIARWRGELFALGWVAVTLLTLFIILRLRRMRRR